MRIGRVAAVTDTGRRRLRNQDSYVSESPLFAVADGMGGAQAGELASQIAAAAIEELAGTDGRGEEAVAELVRRANERVYRRATEDPAAAGMGTTATVALVDVRAGVELGFADSGQNGSSTTSATMPASPTFKESPGSASRRSSASAMGPKVGETQVELMRPSSRSWPVMTAPRSTGSARRRPRRWRLGLPL